METREILLKADKVAVVFERIDGRKIRQRSTFDASKIELAQSLRASGVHAALCSAVPRFSPAKAIVELDATAIVGTRARNS